MSRSKCRFAFRMNSIGFAISIALVTISMTGACKKEAVDCKAEPQSAETLDAFELLSEFAEGIRSRKYISVNIAQSIRIEGRTTAMSNTPSAYALAVTRPDRFALHLASGSTGINAILNSRQIQVWMTPYSEKYARRVDIPTDSTSSFDESVIGRINANFVTMIWLCRSMIEVDPNEYLVSHFSDIAYEGMEQIDGLPHYHLTMRHPEMNLDVWLTAGETRLLRRVVANSVNNTKESKMTTQVDYTDWKFDPIDEAVFKIPSPLAPTPPEN